MADSARPRFLLGSAGSFTKPMADVANLSLAAINLSSWSRTANVTALTHQTRAFLDDTTPAAVQEIELRLLYAGARPTDLHAACAALQSSIGTTKRSLWLIDDDTYDVLTTSNSETAGAATVVEYGSPAKTWFSAGSYLFLPSNGGGSSDEIVVVTAKTDGTPSFTATLAYPHASGTTVYRVGCVYPKAVLVGVRPSEAPLGKGSIVLTFRSAEVALYGTSLPS